MPRTTWGCEGAKAISGFSSATSARQAKDTELIQYATEIKVRAERRCGELLRVSAERGERATPQIHRGSMSNDTTCPPTLSDMGLTRDESSRYQQLAAMPDGALRWKGRISNLTLTVAATRARMQGNCRNSGYCA